MLEIRCFERAQILLDGSELTRFHSSKAKALLLYLAVESNRSHERSHLAGLIWPDFLEGRARRNLSQALTSLRKLLGDGGRERPLISVETHTIGLHLDDAIWVDVAEFEKLVTAVQKHTHPAGEENVCPTCTANLQQAIDLYDGRFLDQFMIADSGLFENWVTQQREAYEKQARDVYARLSRCLEEQRNLNEAIQTIRKLLKLSPWQEEAHQTLMRLLAKKGDRVQALAQYDVLGDVLMAEWGVSPSAETDMLYDQILAGEIGPDSKTALAGQAASAPKTAPFLAPAVSPHFVGREDLIDSIQQQLVQQSGTQNRVALVGMGGIGKTTLANVIGHRLKEQFSDGILWGNSQTSDPHNLLDVWAQAYGNDFSGITDLASKATAVRGMLAHKRVLIIIDNLEEASAVRPLLPNTADCAILVTTRHLDEAVSLDLEPIQLEELPPEKSIVLMEKILGAERVNGSAQEKSAAQKITELVHHLPLAIEIVAQKLKSRLHMTLASMALRLGEKLQRLGLAIGDRAIRGSFELSWQELEPRTQEVFCAMSVFDGRPFTLEALAAIIGLSEFDAEDELYTLLALSLVHEAADMRFKQHPLLADFALEKGSGLQHQTHSGRMIEYYVGFAQSHQLQYEPLTLESENIMAALQAAYDSEQWRPILDMSDALAESWFRFNRYDDAKQAYVWAETAALSLSDDAAVAHTLLHWSEVEIEQSNYDDAWDKLEKATGFFQKLENGRLLARSFFCQAQISFDQGEYVSAEKLLKKALFIQQEENDRIGEATTLDLMGNLYLEVDKTVNRAEELAQKSLSIHKELNHVKGIIPVLRLLTEVNLVKKDFDLADQYISQAVQMSRESHNLSELAASNFLKLGASRLQDDFDTAHKIGNECLTNFQKLGNKRFEAATLRQLALMHLAEGHIDIAEKITLNVKAIFKLIGERFGYCLSLRDLGDVYLKQSKNSQAKKALLEARDVAEFIGHSNMLNLINNRLESEFG